MGNCHPLKTNVNLGFASVEIGFLWVTISHVTLSCSQYLYNGHLRGPVTLTPIAERLEVELSLPVFTTFVCRWDSNTQPSACGANALTGCATAAVACACLCTSCNITLNYFYNSGKQMCAGNR